MGSGYLIVSNLVSTDREFDQLPRGIDLIRDLRKTSPLGGYFIENLSAT